MNAWRKPKVCILWNIPRGHSLFYCSASPRYMKRGSYTGTDINVLCTAERKISSQYEKNSVTEKTLRSYVHLNDHS